MTDIFQEYIEEMKQKRCGATRKNATKSQLYEVLQFKIAEEYAGRLNIVRKAIGFKRMSRC